MYRIEIKEERHLSKFNFSPKRIQKTKPIFLL